MSKAAMSGIILALLAGVYYRYRNLTTGTIKLSVYTRNCATRILRLHPLPICS
jgi:hypothetical protein